MTENLRSRFNAEVRSFFTLSLVNIVFAAITMAFGIAGVVTGIQQLVALQGVELVSLSTFPLGVIAAVVGIWWLTQSAKILSDVNDLRDEAEKLPETSSDEESLRLMIEMMALYRDQRTTVQRMILFSRIGGAVFIGLGVANVISAISTVPLQPLQLVGAPLNIAIGFAAFYVSILFGRYSAAWESRLDETARAEAALKQTMEQG